MAKEILLGIASGLFISLLIIHFNSEGPQKDPIKTIFKSSTTQAPTMRKVLSFENIRVYQYSDSLGTTTIFASEYDFIGVK